MVKIRLFYDLRKLAGQKEIFIEAKSVKELFIKLIEQYDCLKDPLFEDFKKNRIRTEVVVIVNGYHIKWKLNLSTPLKDGDEVAIFPYAGGG